MSSSTVLSSVRRLRCLLAAPPGQERKDEQLLQDFAERRDETAFAMLVRRHGPMVLGVCRRVLGHEQDAEDAFQATFLVLAQRAGSVRDPRALASFLYGTAYHLASKARRAAGRRRKHEDRARVRSLVNPSDELLWREVRALLDEEIARLPEKYRSVFVLCCLEELSQAEAGRRLGMKEGTVTNRLAQARRRLSQRLAQRGVELTAVLAAITLANQPASALPAGLMATTMKAAAAAASGKELASAVSASVLELVPNATAGLIGSKAKIAPVILLTASLMAGVGVWAYRDVLARTVAASALMGDPPAGAPSEKTRRASSESSRETRIGEAIQGRVLDPEGKPVKDVPLYRPRLTKRGQLRWQDSLEWVECGRSDVEGDFRVPLHAGKERDDYFRTLVVAAAGYGLAWLDLPQGKLTEKVTVRLCKDVTIRGRVFSMEGKPLAGVRVSLNQLQEGQSGRLDEYLAFWEQDWSKASGLKFRDLPIPSYQKVLPTAITDREGCFQFSGVGSERIVHFKIQGKGIAQAVLPVVTRPGFDPTALNKSARSRASMMAPYPGLPPVLYGPSFEFVASPERIVEGAVREAGSGKPIAGVRIYGSAGYHSDSEAITDKEGRYRLEGLPKVKQYHFLRAEPSWETSWLSSSIQNREAPDGLQPARVDFTLARGVIIQGRVIDRATGKGVPSSIMYDYLPDNKYAGKPGFDAVQGSYTTDDEREDDSRFRIKVAPGTGVLKAHVSGPVNPFLPAQLTAEDRKRVTLTEDGDFTTFSGGVGFLKLLNAVKWMDLAPDAGVVEQDLYLERGATARVRVQDPEGKPLAGVIVSGIDAIPGQHAQQAYLPPNAECTLVALDPRQPRQVIFYHAERRLAGWLTVRGDEKKPLTVRLASTGSVAGRVRDENGQPIQGADVEIWAKGPAASPSLIYLYIALSRHRLNVRTDKEGRFHLEGVVPDGAFDIDVRHRGAYLDLGSATKQLQVKAGQTLDLGDIRIKPSP